MEVHHLKQRALAPQLLPLCMPVTKLDIAEFIELAAKHPVLDVRSEGEYLHAQHTASNQSAPFFR